MAAKKSAPKKKAMTVAAKKRAATARASKRALVQTDRFCLEYVVTENATQSYMTAYPAVKNANTAANLSWRLLRVAKIKQRIRELRVEHHDMLVATHQEILQEVSGLAMFDPADMFDENGKLLELHEMDPVTRKMVNEIELMTDGNDNSLGITKIKYGKDKKGYIDMMMRHHTLYHDKDSNINNGIIVVQHMYPEDAKL